MFLGVDLGTSSVKAVLIDEQQTVLAEATAPLTVSQPQPLWSEQAPADWVSAAEAAIRKLPGDLRLAVRSMGLSGQMHGATVIDSSDQVLRPAMLWNDGRAHTQCQQLEDLEPQLTSITGNRCLPGFTAPKLHWLSEHEPQVMSQMHKVLLPKDYLRLVWTGDYATDVSDASGTLWLNVAERRWSERALDATGLSTRHMPVVHESAEMTGQLLASAAERLGLPTVPVAAGAGDQAAGAVGVGVLDPGDASLALGTSGVLFIVTDGLRANADEAAHAFCHALPERWHQMSVMLSAANAIDWVAKQTGFATPAQAYAAAQACGTSNGILFLPYLSGERTPHNNPYAQGAFFGLRHDTEPAHLVHAALEGVAFAFADGHDALRRAGGHCDQATVIGGGARSKYWGKLLAAALNFSLVYPSGSEMGPAQGAAFLAQAAATGSSLTALRRQAPVAQTIVPDPQLVEQYRNQRQRWQALYQSTKHLLQQE